MTEFLDEETVSTKIIQLVALNMTKDEQDFVNIMGNTNNLEHFGIFISKNTR